MASIPHNLLLCPRPPPRHSNGIIKCQAIPSASNGHQSKIIRSEEQSGTKRRHALLQIALSAIAFPFGASNGWAAAVETEEGFTKYEDEVNKFQILIPQDWLIGSGEGNGIKSITAFYPQGATDSNVSVVITALGPDFTKLESFGKVDAFAETLVSGLDRSWQRPPGVAAKLIDSKASNGLYYVEYTLQNPGEPHRHLLTALGVASNGWYNRLYTVTGQYIEEEPKFKLQVEKTVSSFSFI